MSVIRLDARRVDSLKPRKRPYDLRDRALKGFGVRVLPSGRKTWFVYSQVRGLRTWKTVGDAAALDADEARERARLMLAAIRTGDDPDVTAAPEILFETVAEEVFRRYGRNWKPNTLRVKKYYYMNSNGRRSRRCWPTRRREPVGRSCGRIRGTRARSAMSAGAGARCLSMFARTAATPAVRSLTATSMRPGISSSGDARWPGGKWSATLFPARRGMFVVHMSPGCRGTTRKHMPKPTMVSKVHNPQIVIAGAKPR